MHEHATFATLTYDPEHYPADGSLNPKHMQLWLKRLRKALAPKQIRFFLVGEYGDQTQRAHYHAALYGIPFTEGKLLASTWQMGFVHCGDLTFESCGYIAGYVTKKLTKPDDPRLEGRHPEFTRMSLKPGIGAEAMVDVGKAARSTPAAEKILYEIDQDVKPVLQHGRRKLPLGRYLKGKLREQVGLPATNWKGTEALLREEEMRAMREAHGRVAFEAAKPFVDWEKVIQTELKNRSKKGKL